MNLAPTKTKAVVTAVNINIEINFLFVQTSFIDSNNFILYAERVFFDFLVRGGSVKNVDVIRHPAKKQIPIKKGSFVLKL